MLSKEELKFSFKPKEPYLVIKRKGMEIINVLDSIEITKLLFLQSKGKLPDTILIEK